MVSAVKQCNQAWSSTVEANNQALKRHCGRKALCKSLIEGLPRLHPAPLDRFPDHAWGIYQDRRLHNLCRSWQREETGGSYYLDELSDY